MPLPYQGKVGVYDNFNPTLLPNFNKNVMQGNGGLAAMSPAAYAAANPQTPATKAITVGGTAAAGNTPAITLTSPQLPGGAITGTYTAIAGDVPADVAEGLASALQAALLSAGVANVEVQSLEAAVNITWPGPAGNSVAVSVTTSGSITLTGAGNMSGGAGPVYAAGNFNFSWNGSTMSFFFGQYYNLGADLVAALVAADMPIV
jgi:hypothetical protein